MSNASFILACIPWCRLWREQSRRNWMFIIEYDVQRLITVWVDLYNRCLRGYSLWYFEENAAGFFPQIFISRRSKLISEETKNTNQKLEVHFNCYSTCCTCCIFDGALERVLEEKKGLIWYVDLFRSTCVEWVPTKLTGKLVVIATVRCIYTFRDGGTGLVQNFINSIHNSSER